MPLIARVCRAACLGTLLLAVALPAVAAPPPAGAADNAGRAVFVRGGVTAEAAAQKRPVKARDPIFQQDVLEAADGASARFVMRDKSMLALQPGTVVSISEYQFKPDDPAADRMVTGVVKGSLRALTGLVDKRGKEEVMLKTQIATIGVRGTEVKGTPAGENDPVPGSREGDDG